jgi:hypothetical protein
MHDRLKLAGSVVGERVPPLLDPHSALVGEVAVETLLAGGGVVAGLDSLVLNGV